VDDVVNGGMQFPKPYWSNISSNDIVRELIDRPDDSIQMELQSLAAGGDY